MPNQCEILATVWSEMDTFKWRVFESTSMPLNTLVQKNPEITAVRSLLSLLQLKNLCGMSPYFTVYNDLISDNDMCNIWHYITNRARVTEGSE